jgi:hypothetical protein
MNTVVVPSGLPWAPSPSGIPTIWYCLVGSLVSGTVSPTLMSFLIVYSGVSGTVYSLIGAIAAVAAAAPTSTAAPTAARTVFRRNTNSSLRSLEDIVASVQAP